MLKRIEWIRGFGIFEDYRGDPGLPDFCRLNVIYGSNGAGKTSLASALDGLRHSPNGFERLSLVVEDHDGARTTGGSDDGLFDRVFVFNEDFVKRNHRLTRDAADMSVVLTVGERTVEAEERLSALRQLVAAKENEQRTASSRAQELDRELAREHERIADSVVGTLSRAGGRYRSRSTYRTDVVRQAFAGSRDGWAVLDEADLAAKQALIQSDERSVVTSSTTSVHAPADLVSRIGGYLRATPVTLVLDSLAAHPHATTWVQDGQRLHEGVDTCIFCGGQVSAHRKTLIEQHFSDGVARLQGQLEATLVQLDIIKSDLEAAVAALPDPALLFSDLQGPYLTQATTYRASSTHLRDWVVALRGRLERKLQNVLVPDAEQIPEPPGVNGRTIGDLLTEHNRRVRHHGELVQVAARELESHFLKAAEARVDELAGDLASARSQADELGVEQTALLAEIAAIEEAEGDPTPSADVLNTEISRLLGHSDLRFESAGGRYRVTRNGRAATGLSEGERTAITLVHFLEVVSRSTRGRGEAIMVVDDPVSSLDSSVFMGVSSMLWSECFSKDHIGQLFLITHSFELFRQWDVQAERLPKSPPSAPYRNAARFYDLKSRYRRIGTGLQRQPVLTAWPPSPTVRQKVRSSYHHAFLALVEAKRRLDEDDSIEHRLDAQLLFPNVIRRLLEAFLAFKLPQHVGDFSGSMRSASGLLEAGAYAGDAHALRLKLTRFAHTYSHSESPETDVVVNPDEVRTAIGAVFTFMKHVDQAHFAGLCENLRLDADELTLERNPGEQAAEA